MRVSGLLLLISCAESSGPTATVDAAATLRTTSELSVNVLTHVVAIVDNATRFASAFKDGRKDLADAVTAIEEAFPKEVSACTTLDQDGRTLTATFVCADVDSAWGLEGTVAFNAMADLENLMIVTWQFGLDADVVVSGIPVSGNAAFSCPVATHVAQTSLALVASDLEVGTATTTAKDLSIDIDAACANVAGPIDVLVGARAFRIIPTGFSWCNGGCPAVGASVNLVGDNPLDGTPLDVVIGFDGGSSAQLRLIDGSYDTMALPCTSKQ